MIGRKKFSTCCCAVNCSIRAGTNAISEVKMFYFPINPERKLMWEKAVNRKDWKASKKSVLCHNHFIGKKPSSDPSHPDYVPSIFAHTRTVSDESAIHRFERANKRAKTCEPDKEMEDERVDGDLLNIQDTVMSSAESSSAEKKVELLEEKLKAMEARFALLELSSRQSATDKILNNPSQLHFYTKLPCKEFFNSLLGLMTSNWQPVSKSRLEFPEQLLLVMMKLRLGLLNQDLAYRFEISNGTVSILFREWICRMAHVMKRFIPEPTQKNVRRHVPKCFIEAKLEKTTSIIDCSDIFIDRPHNLDARAQTFSNYRNNNTVKFLMGCSPTGCITFISKLYGGRISDKEIVEKSGFLSTVKMGDVVLADRGFRIHDDVSLQGAQIFTPAFTKGKLQLSAVEVVTSRTLSRVRVHIERCIGSVKKYGILKITWPLTMLYQVDGEFCTGDHVLSVICALCNLKHSIV